MTPSCPSPWCRGLLAVGLLALPLAVLPEARAIKSKPSREASDHPEAVLVTARNSKTGRAASGSGALVAPNAVLTAAHAVTGFDSFTVTAPYARRGPVRAAVRQVHVHPDFRKEPLENDLAVLVLGRSIDTGGKYPRLCDGGLYPIDTRLLVIGRVDNGAVSNKHLFRSRVTLVPFRGNTNVYGGNPRVVEEGDSGGPVFVAGKEDAIAGVVSGNVAGSRVSVPTDVYTPVSRRNRDWILRQIPKAKEERAVGE